METIKKIAIGSDHAGFLMKSAIIEHLQKRGFDILDEGCYSEERADYPDFAHKVASAVLTKNCDIGILLCGSGNGIAMSANKHKGIRAAICWIPEIAGLARQHNDSNILVLPARYLEREEAFNCVDKFIHSSFEGGRHTQRVQKIDI